MYWLHGLAPPYLTNELQPVSTTATTAISNYQDALVVPPTRLSTIGESVIGLSAFPRCRSWGVEQPACLDYISSDTQHVQAAAENRTFHLLL